LKKAAWHEMETSHVLKELDTDPQSGLSSEEVTRRLEKYTREKRGRVHYLVGRSRRLRLWRGGNETRSNRLLV